MSRNAVRWPWSTVELDQVEVDQHEDALRSVRRRERPHRSCAPPPEPMPCPVCQTDTRGLHVLIGRERLCLDCGMKAMQG